MKRTLRSYLNIIILTPSFNFYPVVGISYEQATAFCRWRTDRVNESIQRRKPERWSFTKVRYRLATKAEWETAAADGLNTDEYLFGLRTRRHQIIYYRWPLYDEPGYKRSIYTVDVRASYANSFGAYNLLGNVSEIVAEKGIAKGGNANWPLDSSKVKLDHYYSKPSNWLGFRCACEIAK